MANDQAVPTVPNIQVPQTQDATNAVGDTINSLLQPIAQGMNAALPDPYIVGKEQQQPHVTQKQPYQPVQKEAPINNQATSVRAARHQNAVAGLANMIGGFANKFQQEKQAKLQDKITDVMKGKQNIENAQKVLATSGISDAQKKMAQSVIDANKKNLDGILSDPKNQKELKKAFDISYVDPAKNKTPEVQAMQGAMKEFQQAGPFNADNPQEHVIAQLANGQGPQQSLTPSTFSNQPKPTQQQISGAPQQSQVPVNNQQVQMGAQPPKQQAAQSQSAGPQQSTIKSTTPYADAALAKDMPTLEINPQYEQAYAQKQQMQKSYLQMLPKIIDAGIKAQIQAAKDGNAQSLAVFKAASTYREQLLKGVQETQKLNQEQKNAMIRLGSENANRLLLTRMRIDSTLKVADSPYLTPQQRAAIVKNAKDDTEKNINASSTNISRIDQDINKLEMTPEAAPGKEERQQQLESLKTQRTMENSYLTEMQKTRADKFNVPTTQAPNADPKAAKESGDNWFTNMFGNMSETFKRPEEVKNGTAKSDSAGSTEQPAIEQVGASDSDEPEDNSDEYGSP